MHALASEAMRAGATGIARQRAVALVCCVLAACTSIPTEAPGATQSMKPTAKVSATAGSVHNTAPAPTAEPAPLVVDLGKVELSALKAELAKKLQVSDKALVIVVVEAVEWGDASLGCPEPGMMYAQVITPGHRVVLAVDGQQYTYHTALAGNFVLCEQAGSSSSAAAIELLKLDLAARSGAAVAEIVVLSSEAVQWSDSALGCAQPGKVYSKVITPGLRVTLELAGKRYDYRTGALGEFVLCESN